MLKNCRVIGSMDICLNGSLKSIRVLWLNLNFITCSISIWRLQRIHSGRHIIDMSLASRLGPLWQELILCPMVFLFTHIDYDHLGISLTLSWIRPTLLVKRYSISLVLLFRFILFSNVAGWKNCFGGWYLMFVFFRCLCMNRCGWPCERCLASYISGREGRPHS
jgi:hypothetical protein